jgi:hypothetical protein
MTEVPISWTWANSILYQMCEERPEHVDPNVVAGKMLLIGRSYAAQIERRSGAGPDGGDAIYARVAARIAASNLDERLQSLSHIPSLTRESIGPVLGVHKFLMDEIAIETGGIGRRSFCSKYLHFHKPHLFLIYDSRARSAIWSKSKSQNLLSLASSIEFDSEYGQFVLRCIHYRDHTRPELTPRQLDDHLFGNRLLNDLDVG